MLRFKFENLVAFFKFTSDDVFLLFHKRANKLLEFEGFFFLLFKKYVGLLPECFLLSEFDLGLVEFLQDDFTMVGDFSKLLFEFLLVVRELLEGEFVLESGLDQFVFLGFEDFSFFLEFVVSVLLVAEGDLIELDFIFELVDGFFK